MHLVDVIDITSHLGEMVKLIQGLLRIDTTNPPGNEGKAAEYLKANFDSNGLDAEIVGETGRENIVATLKGSSARPRLLFLSHTDVVSAKDVGNWKHPPFSAEIADNWIYGRGAWDDKFDAAVQAMSLILLKRQNVQLNGTLLYASVADEEVSGTGAKWLTDKFSEKVAAEYVVGEGGGPPFLLGRRKIYSIKIGEKGLAWLRFRALGKAGHGSIPTLADNANLIMARFLLDLANYKPKVMLIDEVTASIKRIVTALYEKESQDMLDTCLNVDKLDLLLDIVAKKEREIAEELRSLTRMTISPNVIRGGRDTNVIPGVCEGNVDIRLVPTQDRDYATRIVRECAGRTNVEFEIEDYAEASMSTSKSRFYEAIESTFKDLAPECSTMPMMATGMTDSRFWRRMGSIAYGCVPMSPSVKLADVMPGVHGPDERVDVESLEFGTRFLSALAIKVLS